MKFWNANGDEFEIVIEIGADLTRRPALFTKNGQEIFPANVPTERLLTPDLVLLDYLLEKHRQWPSVLSRREALCQADPQQERTPGAVNHSMSRLRKVIGEDVIPDAHKGFYRIRPVLQQPIARTHLLVPPRIGTGGSAPPPPPTTEIALLDPARALATAQATYPLWELDRAFDAAKSGLHVALRGPLTDLDLAVQLCAVGLMACRPRGEVYGAISLLQPLTAMLEDDRVWPTIRNPSFARLAIEVGLHCMVPLQHRSVEHFFRLAERLLPEQDADPVAEVVASRLERQRFALAVQNAVLARSEDGHDQGSELAKYLFTSKRPDVDFPGARAVELPWRFRAAYEAKSSLAFELAHELEVLGATPDCLHEVKREGGTVEKRLKVPTALGLWAMNDSLVLHARLQHRDGQLESAKDTFHAAVRAYTIGGIRPDPVLVGDVQAFAADLQLDGLDKRLPRPRTAKELAETGFLALAYRVAAILEAVIAARGLQSSRRVTRTDR